MFVREYVKKLDDATLYQIVDDYESFERNGSIGDSELREHVNIILNEIDGDKIKFIMWMEILIKEVYRNLAYRYIEGKQVCIMPKTSEYIKQFDEKTLAQFIDDYEQFEKDGFIGECSLRTAAQNLIKDFDDNIVKWMNLIAFETYRYFSNKYFSGKSVADPQP